MADVELARVRAYWAAAHDAYLAHVGTTFQAGRLAVGGTMRESNLWLANAAGLRAGHRVLDAGCGVCGPAVDIARAIPGLHIVGITLCERQAATAAGLIRAAELSDRVRVVTGDYHVLPFADGTFDTVFFFESLGYAGSLAQLFAAVRRVLRAGGALYVKDVFRHERLWSDQEADELAEFDRIYAQRTRTVRECVAAAAAAGFTGIETRTLADVVSTAHARRAMFEEAHGGRLSSFGEMHYRRHSCVPVSFAEVTARTPRP